MDADAGNPYTTIADDLLARLRGRRYVFADPPRAHAVYDTAFHGCYRIEVSSGQACRLAIEKMDGEAVRNWHMAEARRRQPIVGRPAPEEPAAAPSPDEAAYRVEIFEADPDKGQALLQAVVALDWGEPGRSIGRDGVVVFGAVTTDAGFRSWSTWSPDPAVEPAKAAYFRYLRDFAVDQASGDLVERLAVIIR